MKTFHLQSPNPTDCSPWGEKAYHAALFLSLVQWFVLFLGWNLCLWYHGTSSNQDHHWSSTCAFIKLLVPLMACSPFLWILANGNACCRYPCPMRLCWTLWDLSQYWHEGSPILHRVCGTSKLSPQSRHPNKHPLQNSKKNVYNFVVELPWLGPHSLSFFRV